MSLFASLELGKKSLTAAQTGQSTSGHNIANVDTKGFSRQDVQLIAARPTESGVGMGVEVGQVRRIQDEFTKRKVIDETSELGTWNTKAETLDQIQVIFTDLEGNGLRGALDEFWSAWNSLANEPEKQPLRKALVSKGEQLAVRFQSVDKDLKGLRKDLNSRIELQMAEVNDITKEISKLNKQIQLMEIKAGQANDLKDQREELIKKVAEKINIHWYEDNRGNMQIQIGNGHYLVHARQSNDLVSDFLSNNPEFNGIGIRVQSGQIFNVTEQLTDGNLIEMVRLRDGLIRDHQVELSNMAKKLAFKVNQIHSTGTGIRGAKVRETSAYAISRDALTSPLPFLNSGSFHIKILDVDVEIQETVSIEVEAGVDNLETISRKINLASGALTTSENNPEGVLAPYPKLKSEINPDGSITLSSSNGHKFIYGDDNTKFFSNLGLNAFFHTISGAQDIRVNTDFIMDEMKIASGKNLIPGDNSIALQIAQLQFETTMNNNTATFDEFYNSQMTDIGLRHQRAQLGKKNHQQSRDQYVILRDSVSSVSLDEELTNMVKYQRAYEASAKFLSTIDEMTETVINM